MEIYRLSLKNPSFGDIIYIEDKKRRKTK